MENEAKGLLFTKIDVNYRKIHRRSPLHRRIVFPPKTSSSSHVTRQSRPRRRRFHRSLVAPSRKRYLLSPSSLIASGDIIIDGGNSHFPDSNRRCKYLADKGYLPLLKYN